MRRYGRVTNDCGKEMAMAMTMCCRCKAMMKYSDIRFSPMMREQPRIL